MTTTRAEHLQWCKDRANEYLDKGDINNGVTSMLSDLGKHPETQLKGGDPLSMLGMMAIMQVDLNQAKKFVNGFN